MTPFYKQLQSRVTHDRDTHISSAQYYQQWYLYITIPIVVLTTLGSTLAFVSTSNIVADTDRQVMSLIVGIIGIIASLVQSVANTLAYGTQSQSFTSAARQYDQLVVKIMFETELPDEADFIQMIEKRLLDIRAQCGYYPPQHIMKQYTRSLYDADGDGDTAAAIPTTNLIVKD